MHQVVFVFAFCTSYFNEHSYVWVTTNIRKYCLGDHRKYFSVFDLSSVGGTERKA
jgi:hypothetical protein